MSRIKTSLDHKRIQLLIWLVLTIFVLLGYSLQSVAGNAYYSILMQNYTTVGSPPVIIQNGTAGTSTIYTNNTSAKVSVEAPLFDYVDDNDLDVDSSADRGMHSNFPAQQAGPDSTYDTLTEENTEAIEDYVDNNTSDVDSSADVGSHSNFENQKDYDSIYDTLTEQNTAGEGITKVGTDTSGTGNNLTLSFSHTLVSGTARIVIVSIGVENGNTTDVSTVTYGGVTMTLAVEGIVSSTGFFFLCEIWYILENDLPSDGSQTVEITCSGIPYELEVNGFCSEYAGVTQGAPEATAEHNQTIGTTITNDISPSDNAWVISAVGAGNSDGSFTHGQGQVEVLDFQDFSSTFAVAELRGGNGETSLDSTYSGTLNRLERVAASWTEATEDDNYELDLEIQFTSVIDFLPTETLCINTGTFSGTEDINVDFWNGTGWENLATDLTAYSSNQYTVSLISTTFTIRFKGGTETSDTTQDQWQIDASLLRVEGAGSKEDAVDQQSNVDGSADVGTHSNFTALQYGPDSIYDNMNETSGGGLVLSVEELSVALSTAQTSNTGTLTEVSDTTQAVPFATRYVTTAGGTIDAHNSHLTDISVSGTTVTIERTTTDSKAVTTTMYWVEFGSSINVYSGSFTISASTSGTASIGATVDLSKSFLIFYYRSAATTNEHAYHAVRGYFSSTSQLTFELTSANTINGHWWVVEDTGSNFDVDAVNVQLSGVSSNTGSFSAVTMASTMVVASYEGGSSDDIIHGGVSVYLSSTTQITAVRGGTSGTIDVTTYVIEFSGDTSVQRGDIPFTTTQASQSDPITEVTLGDSMAWIPTGWINTAHCTSGGTGSSDNLDVIVRVSLTSSTQITGDRNINGANDAVIHWEVVEWEVGGGTGDYQLDLEVQWIDLPYSLPNETLCIYGGTMGAEDINVDVWNGTGWETVFTDLSSGWNNASITDWLATSNFTIRFKGGTETGDANETTWQIDVALIHVWHDGGENYELDLEVQWTNADYDETNEELAIYVEKGNTHSLDATGGYMIIGDGTPDWGSTTGTISFWVKWDTVANRSWGQHDNMETRFSGGINLILDWGAVGSITSSTSFTAGKWYFIAIVWNENTDDLYLYVGDQNNVPTQDFYNNNWTTPVSTVGVTQNNFMASKNGVEPMDGHGDDLRYWNIDRTLTEIQSDYNTELTGSETNLRSYFKLNNNFDDIGPNNNDGSGSGSYSFSGDVPFPEKILVDIWNGISWQNLFTDLTNGWNNASVSSYLNSSTFTIRFKGDNETGDTTQDNWNIDATLLHVWTNIQAPTSWLSGWDKRVRITIDNNDVDSPLSNFPVLVHLSNSSGHNNDDATFVFDEVGSNSKKIAVTTSDGTQCYVEIERWDDASEQAWFWVKVPSISNTTDTELYLYYDMDHADNTVYVGDTGSTAAQNVWDTNFKGVWHLKDLTNSTVVDSTSNNNDGTKGAADQPIEIDAKIGKGQDFTPTAQYIEVGTTGFSASNGTVEAWGKAEGFSGTEANYLFGHTTQPPWANRTQLYTDDANGTLDLGLGDSHTRHTNIQDLDPNTWYHIVLTWNGTNYVVYVDSVPKANGTYSGLTSIYSLADIGNTGSPAARVEAWNGTIDEVRVSDVPRSAAWIKANYESGRDDLLGFGSEETRGRAEEYDFVLQVANQVANNWTINLQVYDSSNLARLSKATISFHDGNSSDQIIVSDGSLTQSEGSPYNLAGNATIYISICNLQATTTDVSYLYVHLKIQVPDTSTYMLHVITFEIA